MVVIRRRWSSPLAFNRSGRHMCCINLRTQLQHKPYTYWILHVFISPMMMMMADCYCYCCRSNGLIEGIVGRMATECLYSLLWSWSASRAINVLCPCAYKSTESIRSKREREKLDEKKMNIIFLTSNLSKYVCVWVYMKIAYGAALLVPCGCPCKPHHFVSVTSYDEMQKWNIRF